MAGRYLVYLNWPERCFRAERPEIECLKTVLPPGSAVVRVRSDAAFLRELPKATNVLTWHFKKEWFSAAKRMKVLATPAAGRELVAWESAPSGVKVHFGHFHGPIIAESVAAFVLAWARGFFAVERQDDPWPRTWLGERCLSVAGTKADVVGYGNIGRAIGAKLESLGVEVTGVTRHGVFRKSQRIAARGGKSARQFASADWCVLALPSTAATDNWLDAALVARLPRRCVVVNVGRGNAVDERALYDALKSRRIAGAYLDVRKHEPSATVLEAPGYVPELAKLPNCVVMPHSSAFYAGYMRSFFMELKADACL